MTPDQQLQAKLKLEGILKRELRKVFNRIAHDYRISILRGRTVPASRYHQMFSTVLDNHYAKVQKKFTGSVRQKYFGFIKQEDERSEEELLAIFLLNWRDNRVFQTATLLTGTTQRDLDRALARARSERDAEGRPLPEDEVAALTFKLLRRIFRGRESTIAITETNAPAESTKLAEIAVEDGADPNSVLRGTAVTMRMKIWNTVGDKRVRPHHRIASGQIKFLNEPFIVKNQRLMYPGDTSFGASSDNVINCRCYLTYN